MNNVKTVLYDHSMAKQLSVFLKEYSPNRDVSYYKWKYDRPCGDITTSLMLLKENEQIIGCLSSLGDYALVCNEKTIIRVLVDFYVKKEYRQKGYGAKLLSEYLSKFPDDIFIAFGPTQKSAPLFQKLKGRSISNVFKRFYFYVDIPYAINQKMQIQIPEKLQLLINPILYIYLKFRGKCIKKKRTYKIYNDIDVFFKDERIRQIWTEKSRGGKYDFVSSVTLEHFKIYKPGAQKEKFFYIAVFNGKNEPVAACVVFINNRMHAELVEYAGGSEDLKYLFLVAIEFTVQYQGKVLAITTSTREYEGLLKNLLFVKAQHITAHFYSKNPNVCRKLLTLKSFSVSSGMADGW